mmetsp:Transcript_27452/g.71885  ORF Transcript_27452/g.71885 Transcript_27452/m.71885 type:complete len:301 (+) Transcript_27452:1969-2871(+)
MLDAIVRRARVIAVMRAPARSDHLGRYVEEELARANGVVLLVVFVWPRRCQVVRDAAEQEAVAVAFPIFDRPHVLAERALLGRFLLTENSDLHLVLRVRMLQQVRDVLGETDGHLLPVFHRHLDGAGVEVELPLAVAFAADAVGLALLAGVQVRAGLDAPGLAVLLDDRHQGDHVTPLFEFLFLPEVQEVVLLALGERLEVQVVLQGAPGLQQKITGAGGRFDDRVRVPLRAAQVHELRHEVLQVSELGGALVHLLLAGAVHDGSEALHVGGRDGRRLPRRRGSGRPLPAAAAEGKPDDE